MPFVPAQANQQAPQQQQPPESTPIADLVEDAMDFLRGEGVEDAGDPGADDGDPAPMDEGDDEGEALDEGDEDGDEGDDAGPEPDDEEEGEEEEGEEEDEGEDAEQAKEKEKEKPKRRRESTQQKWKRRLAEKDKQIAALQTRDEKWIATASRQKLINDRLARRLAEAQQLLHDYGHEEPPEAARIRALEEQAEDRTLSDQLTSAIGKQRQTREQQAAQDAEIQTLVDDARKFARKYAVTDPLTGQVSADYLLQAWARAAKQGWSVEETAQNLDKKHGSRAAKAGQRREQMQKSREAPAPIGTRKRSVPRPQQRKATRARYGSSVDEATAFILAGRERAGR